MGAVRSVTPADAAFGVAVLREQMTSAELGCGCRRFEVVNDCAGICAARSANPRFLPRNHRLFGPPWGHFGKRHRLARCRFSFPAQHREPYRSPRSPYPDRTFFFAFCRRSACIARPASSLSENCPLESRRTKRMSPFGEIRSRLPPPLVFPDRVAIAIPLSQDSTSRELNRAHRPIVEHDQPHPAHDGPSVNPFSRSPKAAASFSEPPPLTRML